jgi:hypothetical protein
VVSERAELSSVSRAERFLSRAFNLRQQDLLDGIATNREAFPQLPDQIFAILKGDRWREDLYLFRNEALPLAENMLQTLGVLTNSQQNQLQKQVSEIVESDFFQSLQARARAIRDRSSRSKPDVEPWAPAQGAP